MEFRECRAAIWHEGKPVRDQVIVHLTLGDGFRWRGELDLPVRERLGQAEECDLYFSDGHQGRIAIIERRLVPEPSVFRYRFVGQGPLEPRGETPTS